MQGVAELKKVLAEAERNGLLHCKALEFEARGKRKHGRPKKTWKMQLEKESKNVGLEKKDAMNRAR